MKRMMTGFLEFLEGHGFDTRWEENRIVVEFQCLADAMQLMKPWHTAQRRAAAVNALHEMLQTAGMMMEVRIHGRVAAVLGGAACGGWLLRLIS